MRRLLVRWLTSKQRLDVQTAVFMCADVCRDNAARAATDDERQAWNVQGDRYADAYQAIFGRRAADRYRARSPRPPDAGSGVPGAQQERAPRHAPTAPRLDNR